MKVAINLNFGDMTLKLMKFAYLDLMNDTVYHIEIVRNILKD